MNRIIRILLNKLRKMDGRRPLLWVVGVLAVLVLTAAVLGRITSAASEGGRQQGTDGLLQGELAGDTDGLGDDPQDGLSETVAQTTASVETEDHRIPIGMVYYVKLTEYGADLPYYDQDGNQLGRLHHRDQIEVLPWEGDQALFYYNEEYDTAVIDVRYLSEADPGRLTRPAVQPAISAENAGEVSIHIWKERRDLELLSDGEVIATYSVGLGGWPWDHKIAKGDSRTPEGEYYICVRNSHSQFHLSLGISYPNKEDAANGYEYNVISKRQKNAIDKAIDNGQKPPWDTALGGEIMIHGESEDGIGAQFDWTAGCIAVSNEVMDILWEYCGMGTDVIISP